MKRNKWIGVMVLSAAMLFGVTACGGGNKTGTDTVAQSEAQGAEEEADAQDTADKDTVPVSDLEYKILDDGTAAIVGCKNGDKYKTLIIPEEIDGYKVTAIGIPDMGRVTANILFNSEADSTYDGEPTVEKLIIPDTVTVISYGSIGINKNLREVDLGNGVEIIEEYAFGNTGIEKIEFPKSLKKLGYLALPISLKEATFLGGDLEECGNYFYEDCVVNVPAGSKTEEVVKKMVEEAGGTVISE